MAKPKGKALKRSHMKPKEKLTPRPRFKRVQISMARVYSIGPYKTLRYEVLADAEVPDDALPSDVVDEVTEFCDGKIAQFAADRDLDHLAQTSRGESPFEEDDEDAPRRRPSCWGRYDDDEDCEDEEECDHYESCMKASRKRSDKDDEEEDDDE